ncbi:hypothetical protein ACFV3R_18105 [Streptomyces sp. NPDC059740]
MTDLTPLGDGWSLHHAGASLPARVRAGSRRGPDADHGRAASYPLGPV